MRHSRPVVFGPHEVTHQQARFAVRSAEKAVLLARLWGAKDARDALNRLGELGDEARRLAGERPAKLVGR